MSKTLLINFVYCNPVGHVVEAIKFSHGFHLANRNLEISVLINKRSPYELLNACPWIKKVFPVDTYKFKNRKQDIHYLNEIPAKWDYIAVEDRAIYDYETNGYDKELDLVYFHRASDAYFKAKIWKGSIWHKDKYPSSLKSRDSHKTVLSIPSGYDNFMKKYEAKNKKICILPAGSNLSSHYPSYKGWDIIIKGLKDKFPNTDIFITGISRRIKGRTNTGFNIKDLNHLLKSHSNLINCFDIGFWNQLSFKNVSELHWK